MKGLGKIAAIIVVLLAAYACISLYAAICIGVVILGYKILKFSLKILVIAIIVCAVIFLIL